MGSMSFFPANSMCRDEKKQPLAVGLAAWTFFYRNVKRRLVCFGLRIGVACPGQARALPSDHHPSGSASKSCKAAFQFRRVETYI
jgi:hypothetical protein